VKGGVHLLFEGEKVRPEYAHVVPLIPKNPPRAVQGYWIAPLESLVRMKLTSFRLKDQVHIQDLLAAGLITAEIESALPAGLRARLEEVKASPL
jgi:hypothetical protein